MNESMKHLEQTGNVQKVKLLQYVLLCMFCCDTTGSIYVCYYCVCYITHQIHPRCSVKFPPL